MRVCCQSFEPLPFQRSLNKSSKAVVGLSKSSRNPQKPGICFKEIFKSFEYPTVRCSKLEPFCETNLANLANFGRNLANFGECWRNFGGNLANFGGIALWQVNLGYFG